MLEVCVGSSKNLCIFGRSGNNIFGHSEQHRLFSRLVELYLVNLKRTTGPLKMQLYIPVSDPPKRTHFWRIRHGCM